MTSSSSNYLINGHSGDKLSVTDRGLAYGDGVFRTMRIRQGLPVCWDLHYKKLLEDCNSLAIACPDAEILLTDIKHLFATDEEAVAKIVITRGESKRGYAVPALMQSTRIVIKTPLPNYPEENFNEGVKLHLCALRLSHQPLLAGIKHLNRLENVLARMEWTDSQIADGLLLDAQEHVIECTMSNIFIRFDENLVTPELTKCGVAGITRQRILEAAPVLGYRTQVTQIPYAKLLQADEVVICNSLYGVWQVRTLNGKRWQHQGLAAQLRNTLQE